MMKLIILFNPITENEICNDETTNADCNIGIDKLNYKKLGMEYYPSGPVEMGVLGALKQPQYFWKYVKK